MQGVTTISILVEDDAWKWTKGKMVQDVVKLVAFYSNTNNERVK